MNENLKFGITSEFTCNYLPDKQERLLVAVDEKLHNEKYYTWLMQEGFRRSGDQIYRPHCQHCRACESLRVVVNDFCASKSQKRLLKKNQHLQMKVASKIQDNYYPLYEKYINTLHSDGSMFPANKEQYSSFIRSNITQQLFIEIWHDELLISVAVTDNLVDALSAVYTFYDPDYRKSGLGVFSILNQLQLAEKMHKKYLYLGYQIDDCQKMNYKNRYFPHQRLSENNWKTINK
ncbi:MAG: arginyltransferase [Thalassotalea sp.]